MVCVRLRFRRFNTPARLCENLAYLNSQRTATGRPLRVSLLPRPQPFTGRDGRRVCRSYMNFYLVNGGLILPQFDDPADSEAKSILQNIWPDRQIILVADEDFRVGERGREDEKCIAFSTASQ